MARSTSIRDDTIPCYIVNLVTGTKIEVVHIPEDFSEGHSAAFSPQTIRGRSSPIQGYDSSGPGTFDVTLQINDDYSKKGIEVDVNNLVALTYPGYDNKVVPPRVFFRLGVTSFTGICNNVSVTWRKPYRRGKYINADVSLNFSSVNASPFTATDVEGGAR